MADIQAQPGGTMTLRLLLVDGSADKTVTATVIDDAGAQVTGSPFALPHVGAGDYVLTVAAPVAEGDYPVRYDVFDPPGPPNVSALYPFPSGDDIVRVRKNVADEVIAGEHDAPNTLGGMVLSAAAQGLENCIDDQLEFGSPAPIGQPHSCRRRVFTPAAYALASPGSDDDDDNESARYRGTFVYSGTNLVSMRWERVL